MKKTWIAGLLMAAGALTLPAAGFAQGAAAVTVEGSSADARLKADKIELRAKVVELDLKNRVAVLRGPKGKIVMVDVPADVKGLDQVRVGDDLVFRYAEAVVAKLEKVSGAGGIRERVENTQEIKAPEGTLPGAANLRTVQVLAKVMALNPAARTVTLRGATRTTTLKVPADMDMKAVKVGDEVLATYIEAAVLEVERPAGR